MFSLFGFAGQHLYNALDARHNTSSQSPFQGTNTTTSNNNHNTSILHPPTDQPPLWKRILSSPWSPIKVLSDSDYETLLKQKLLRLEAEIARIDEEIARCDEEIAKEKAAEDARKSGGNQS
ncbi:MAG: hypothetical protein Q9183_007567, partial [Haloplaca sp. 2 TL-2023]